MTKKKKRCKPSRLGKTKYKITNWSEYNESLRKRGDITIWISDDILNAWHPEHSGQRGRPQAYSDQANQKPRSRAARYEFQPRIRSNEAKPREIRPEEIQRKVFPCVTTKLLLNLQKMIIT